MRLVFRISESSAKEPEKESNATWMKMSNKIKKVIYRR